MAEDDEVFQLADAVIEKPLIWARSVPFPSAASALSFVKFRIFDRAVKGYCSIVHLLKLGQWEDVLVLARSLYELNLNLSEISCSPDPERAAKRFIRFGKFERLHLEQRRLKDQLQDERLKPQPDVEALREGQRQLEAATSKLKRDFAEFRHRRANKWQWQESWSGATREQLAERLAEKTGGQKGQSDYFIFKLGSLFVHNSPGALFFVLAQDCETIDWKKFCKDLHSAGLAGLRKILHEASVCLVDIVGAAGDAIAGYERDWFDSVALPLLGEISSCSTRPTTKDR